MSIHEARVEFRPHDTAPAMGRRVLDGLADRLPETVLDDARLLLTELMTNAIRHAGERSDDTISILVRAASTELFVEVSDRGRGFGSDPPKPPRVPGTGWGLFLLDRLADSWGLSDGEASGATVWFRLRW